MNKLLSPNDIVGGSFWLLSIAMIAAAFFFFVERSRVDGRWQTSMTLMGVVMVVAAVQYYYLKEMWVATGEAPLILRYIDWALSRPIQIVSIFVFLIAVTKLSTALFWRLLVGALVTVVAEFLGSGGYLSPTLGFLIGMVGWLYVLGELYLGEASTANSTSGNERSQTAFFSLRLIITVGWAIYPLGYFMQYLGGGVDVNTLNVIYNFADILNKLIFGLVIYVAAYDRAKLGAA
jgi:bacteriorhodopsin